MQVGAVTTKCGGSCFSSASTKPSFSLRRPALGFQVCVSQLKLPLWKRGLSDAKNTGLAAHRFFLSKTEDFLLCHVGIQFFPSSCSDVCSFLSDLLVFEAGTPCEAGRIILTD